MLPVTHVLFLAGGNGRNAISGAEHHVMTLVRELASRRVDTELLVLLWATDPHIDATLASLRACGVRVSTIERRPGRHTLLSRLVRALECWHRLSIALRDRRERVVHLHAELVMQVLAARIAGCRRLVMTIHSNAPHYRRWPVRKWYGVLVRSGIRFVAISNCVHRYLVESVGVPSTSVTTIKYGIRPPDRLPVSRADVGLADTAFVVGFVGRLTEAKNLQLLIRAMAERPDVTAVIVGQGELGSRLESLARSLECHNVRFVGAWPNAGGVMPLFDVFCLPSVWEGLGVVLLEAMHHGVPIIGSRAGAIPEVLDHGRCGVLIDPHSVASLVEAIDKIRSDGALRQSIVEAARVRVATVYGVERMGNEVCALYSEALEAAPMVAEAAASRAS